MTTYTLQIFNPDGSLYWTEHSNVQGFLENWLAQEQTRPYWNSNFTFTITAVVDPKSV